MERNFQGLARINELKLMGIPLSDNENLTELFSKIANIIGYDITNTLNIPSMTRAMIRSKTSGEFVPSQIIIMKFIATHIKENFYSLYLRLLPKKAISTKDLGFTNDIRVIIGENLTQQNMDIFKAASSLKREKKIAQLFTVNGIVNVKIIKGTKPHEIRDIHQLEMLTNSQLGHNEEQVNKNIDVQTSTNNTQPTANADSVNNTQPPQQEPSADKPDQMEH